MNKFRKEYFNDYHYFLIEGDGEDFTLYYSSYNVITEGKKNSKKKFEKKDLNKIEEKVKKITKTNKKVSKKELEELVDSDGTMLSSKVPYLNMYLHPKKTMDQTVVAARISNDPVTRGYRVYYGENEEKNDEVLSEVNMEDTFGYEETKDKDLKGTLKQLEKMGIEDPVNKLERAKKLGKRKDTKIVKNKKGEKIIKNLNLFEKETLDEIKRQKMIKMVEDIITQKEKGDSDIVNKDSAISRILSKNLEAIKKLAEKEGISLNKLINILKKGE